MEDTVKEMDCQVSSRGETGKETKYAVLEKQSTITHITVQLEEEASR